MAQYPLAFKDSVTQAFSIDFLARKLPNASPRWTEPGEIEDDWMRLMILSQAVATPYKEQARLGMQRDPAGHRFWLKDCASAFLKGRWNEMKALGLFAPDLSSGNLSAFPPGSWSIQFTFTLKKPYISRDDVDFYILDNPLKKEWVFKLPYIAPSQWKGALRSAMVRELTNDSLPAEEFARRRFQMAVLFGDEKGEEPGSLSGLAEFLDEEGGTDAASKFRQLVREHFGREEGETLSHHRGNLHFYPTYFDRMGLEMINPHDRETGSGKLPIYFECVPDGADSKGIFSLICVPLAGPEQSRESIEKPAKRDIEAVARGIRAMMTHYGFGAKTGSGFGLARADWKLAAIQPREFDDRWQKVWLEEGK
jgi:CRISPR-associated protein Cmr2